jgi:hypothetical protein
LQEAPLSTIGAQTRARALLARVAGSPSRPAIAQPKAKQSVVFSFTPMLTEADGDGNRAT